MLGRIARYEVKRVIGTGGRGVVLKGIDTDIHRVVALKVWKPHLAHNGAVRQRFAGEAQLAAAVVQQQVIPIYDAFTDGDTPYLVMDYVPGQSLPAGVAERGPLDPRAAQQVARQAAAGLAANHVQARRETSKYSTGIICGTRDDFRLLTGSNRRRCDTYAYRSRRWHTSLHVAGTGSGNSESHLRRRPSAGG